MGFNSAFKGLKRPDRFWSTGSTAARLKRLQHDAEHSSCPVPKLRVTGAPLTHMSVWRTQAQPYLYLWCSKVPYRVQVRASGPYPEQLHYSLLLVWPYLEFTVQYNLFSHLHDFSHVSSSVTISYCNM